MLRFLTEVVENMCLSKCLIQWNFAIPELVNLSDSASQFLAGTFVAFVADVRVLGFICTL